MFRLLHACGLVCLLVWGCGVAEPRAGAAADVAIGFGEEFWRTPADRTSDLASRAQHTVEANPGGGRFEGAFAASFDDQGANLAGRPGAAPIRLRTTSFRAGNRTLDPLHERRFWTVAGDTAQAALEADGRVVEHFRVRAEGLEWTWILREKMAGPVRLEAALDGLHPLKRQGAGLAFADAPGLVRAHLHEATAVDAAGRRWPLEIVPSGQGFAIEVPDEVLEGARWPLAIDPLVTTSEIALDTAGTSTADSGAPAIAWSGSTGLVAWVARDLSPMRVVARRIDTSGRPIDALPITVATNVTTANVSVAANGSMFLVAGIVNASTPSPFATRIRASDGVVIDTVLTGGGVGYSAVTAASNGTDFLVVPYIQSSRWAAVRIPGDGSPAGTTRVLSSFPWSAPVIAAPKGGDFVIFSSQWTGSYCNYYSYTALRVRASDGTLIDSSARALSFAGSNFSPTISAAAAPDGTGFLLVAEASPCSYTPDVYAYRLGPDLALVGTSTRLAVGNPAVSGSSVTVVGSNYLVSWAQALNGPTKSDVFGARIRISDGVNLDPYGLGLFLAPNSQTLPRLAPIGTTTDLVLVNGETERPGVFQTTLSDTGSGYTAGTTAALSTREDLVSQMRVASTSTVALAVWQDDRDRLSVTDADIYAARLSPVDGTVLDSTPLHLATGASSQLGPQVATDGTRFLVGWTENTGSAQSIQVVLVAADGTWGTTRAVSLPNGLSSPVLRSIVRVSDGWLIGMTGYVYGGAFAVSKVGDDGSPGPVTPTYWSNQAAEGVLVRTSTGLVAVASVYNTSTGYDIVASRVDPSTLQFSDGTGIAVSKVVGDQRYPAAVADGADVLVTWLDQRVSGRVDVYGARIDTRNLLADPFPSGRSIAQSVNVLSVNAQSLASDGSRFLFAMPLANAPLRYAIAPLASDLTLQAPLAAVQDMGPVGSVALASPGKDKWLLVGAGPGPNGGSRARARFIGDAPTGTGTDAHLSIRENTSGTVSAPSLPAGEEIEIVRAPASGTVSISGDTMTYTPAQDFFGTDRFTWRTRKWLIPGTNEWTVDVDVTEYHAPPTAKDGSTTLDEDTTGTAFLDAASTAGSLRYVIVTPPVHGTLSGQGPTLTYTPQTNWNGSDGFTWYADDGSGPSNVATHTLTVRPVNDLPLPAPLAVTTAEDTQAAVELKATDVEGDPLTFAITTAPAHGSLTGTPPHLTYVPDANFHGSDSLAFTVSDGTGTTAPTVVPITVTAVNDAPVLAGAQLSTAQDAALPVHLDASDVDGDALSFTVQGPQHGTLSGTAPDLVYSPAAGFSGTDAFVVTVSDGTASVSATFTIDVSRVNHAPVVNAAQLSTLEDVPLPVTLSAFDADGDTLTYLVDPPQYGRLTGTAPNLQYLPPRDVNGADYFTFRVSDGTVESGPARIDITVVPVNDPPVATVLTATTREDSPVVVTLSGTDPDGDRLQFGIAAAPAHGTLSGRPPTMQYLPNPDFNGTDTFTYTAQDGTATSAPASVTITVTPVNDAPVALAGSLSVDEDASAELVLTGRDADGDALTFRVTAPPAHGTLRGTAPRLTYVPAPDYHGTDSLQFTATDGQATSAPATVAITVNPTNDPPVALASTWSGSEDAPISLLLAGRDPDGDPLSFELVSLPTHGTLEGTPPDLRFVPERDWSGHDEFTFAVTDGLATSAPVTVALDLAAVNDAPSAVGGTVATSRNHPVSLTFSGADAEGDALSFEVVTAPLHGTLEGSGATRSYVPARDFKGHDQVTFVAFDGQLRSEPATIEILVDQGNRAPVVEDATYDTKEDTAVTFRLGATDPEGGAVSFVVTSQPLHGTLSGTAPDLTYTPEADWSGYDELSFTADDGADVSAAAVVRIHVLAVNDVPVVQPLKATTMQDAPVTLELVGSDADGDEFRFAVVDEPKHGKATISGKTLTYEPEAGYAGVETFTYRALDTWSDSAPAQIAITVVDPTPVDPENPGEIVGGCSTSGAGLLALAGLLARRRRHR